jgi:hypothetical protein
VLISKGTSFSAGGSMAASSKSSSFAFSRNLIRDLGDSGGDTPFRFRTLLSRIYVSAFCEEKSGTHSLPLPSLTPVKRPSATSTVQRRRPPGRWRRRSPRLSGRTLSPPGVPLGEPARSTVTVPFI